MASMARSGETLLLKCMDAHSRITAIGHGYNEGLLGKLEKLDKSKLFFIKQGTWEEKQPFSGFILARSPVSIYFSLLGFAHDKEGISGRLRRWMRKIDTSINLNGDDIQNFCTFYNRRMGKLLDTDNPILRYEEFVQNPEYYLGILCNEMKVQYEKIMCESHKLYNNNNKKGHGGINNMRPIDTRSMYKWKKLDPSLISYIIKHTKHIHNKYGYVIGKDDVILKREWDRIW